LLKLHPLLTRSAGAVWNVRQDVAEILFELDYQSERRESSKKRIGSAEVGHGRGVKF